MAEPASVSARARDGVTRVVAAALLGSAAALVAPGCAPSPQDASSPSAIYGPDNRLDVQDRRVTALARARARSVGMLIAADRVSAAGSGAVRLEARRLGDAMGLCPEVRFRAQPAAGFCSGFLVGPDLVATAGHCLLDASQCEAAKFVFDFMVHRDGADPTVVPESSVYGCQEIVRRDLDGTTGADYALFRLDRPVRDRPVLPVNGSGTVRYGADLAVIGYPNGLPLKVAVGGMVTGFDPGFVFFRGAVDAFHGNSGSPVFDAATGTVRGILVRGMAEYAPDRDRGCVAATVCTLETCPGEDIMRTIFPLR